MEFQEFKDACILKHNEFRQLHGSNALIHSIDLDKSAQGWADVLSVKGNVQKSHMRITDAGENIICKSISNLSGSDVADEWYEEIKWYDFTMENEDAEHFTQMIWKSTKEVGFGLAQSDDKCFIVAHYRPAGNIQGEYRRNVFPPNTSANSSGSGCGSTSNVNGALDDSYGEGIRPYIDIIDNLRKFGLQEFLQLPNVVVVGDQSSGKSSIIELISGIPLPRGTGIVTRCPLELQLKKVIDREWNATLTYKLNTGENIIRSTFDPQEVEVLVKDAQDTLCETRKGVSNELITLRIESPEVNAPDLTMIDLPGIARTAIEDQPLDICDQIKKMIKTYVNNENTVILCVISGDLDMGVNESVNIARKVDPDGLRTIGVITKPDIADQEHKLGVLRMLDNKVIDLKKGFNLVKSRSSEQLRNKLPLAEFLKNEMQFFENDPIYKEADMGKCGALNLSRKITEELVNVIKIKLPELQSKIESLLEQSLKEFSKLPPDFPQTDEGKRCYMMNIAMEFNEKIKSFLLNGEKDGKKNNFSIWRNHFQKFQTSLDKKENVAHSKQFSLPNIEKMIVEFRGKEIPGFLTYEVFETLMKNFVQSCQPEAKKLIAEVRKEIKQDLENLLMPLVCHLPAVENDLQVILNSESAKSMKCVEERIDFIFKQETIVFTMDNVFEEKWEKNEEENRRISGLNTTPSLFKSSSLFSSNTAPSQFGSTPTVSKLSDNTKRMQDCIKSYLKIVHTRLCDNIPMAIVQCLLIQHHDDLKTRLLSYLSSKETIEKCKELPTIMTRRSKLNNKISCLCQGKNELEEKYNILM